MSQTTSNPEISIEDAAPAKVEALKEHRWLRRLLGEWTYEHDLPGQPARKSTGTESVRPLGDLWVLAEGRGTMPDGGPATTLMTLGYDSEKKRFVGTWIGSMMTFLWSYDGELDAGQRILTLNSTGPSMAGDGKMVQYQDVIEFKSDDHRTLTSRTLGQDGTWQPFMTVEYRRTK